MNKEVIAAMGRNTQKSNILEEAIYQNLIVNQSDDFRSPADWAYKLARRPHQIASRDKNKVLYLNDFALKITLPDENGEGYKLEQVQSIHPDWTVIQCDKLYTEPFGYMKFELTNGCIHFNLHYNSFQITKSLSVECKPVLFDSIIFDIVNKTIRYESATSTNDEDDIVRTVRGLKIDGYFINRKNELINEVNALCLTHPEFKKAAYECNLNSILKLNSPEAISAELSRYIIHHSKS